MLVKPHWFYILLSLAESDRHGHGIMRRAREASDGQVKLWPVTLYASLDELISKAWIRELTGADHPSGESQRRRYFSITNDGRRILQTEAKRIGALSKRALQASK